jgi:predicted TPR repeat methyltransferase
MTLLLRPLVDSLVAVEPATNLLPTLAQRLVGSDVDLVVATASDYLKNAPAASLDALVMINVLEHIAEHQDTLRGCHRALARGGYLLLFVPALPTLFGSLDRQFGHHRRYRHAELRQDLVASGFSIVRLSYVDLAGVIAWYVAGRILGAASISAGSARAYDRLIVPLMRPIERFVRPPFGKNLMAVARA